MSSLQILTTCKIFLSLCGYEISALDYGGKFYLKGNQIYIQDFYLNGQGSYVDRYTRKVSKGTIRDDTLRIVYFNHEQMYVKWVYGEVFR